MKNNNGFITAPLFVSVVFILISISEKLLAFISKAAPHDIVFSVAILELFVFALPAAFFIKIKKENFLDFSKLSPVKLSYLPFIVSSFLTYVFGAVIVLYIQMNFLGAGASTGFLSVTESASVSSFSIFLYYVFIPAFTEELFFRSVIISSYSSFKGPVAVIISSFFFALIHFSFGELPFYFFSGVVLGTITYVTGSCIPSLVLHLINNAVIVYGGGALGTFLSESSSSVILAFLLVVAFLGSLMSMLSTMEEIYDKRSIAFENGNLPGKRRAALEGMSKAGIMEKKKERDFTSAKNAFLSPTFLVAIVLFILITLKVI